MSIQAGCLKSKFSGLKISRSGFVSCGKQLAQSISSTFKTKIKTPQKPVTTRYGNSLSLHFTPLQDFPFFFSPSVDADHEMLAEHIAFLKIGVILPGTELR